VKTSKTPSKTHTKSGKKSQIISAKKNQSVIGHIKNIESKKSRDQNSPEKRTMRSPGRFLEEREDGVISTRGARNNDYSTLDHKPIDNYQPKNHQSPLKSLPPQDYYPFQSAYSTKAPGMHNSSASYREGSPDPITHSERRREKVSQLPFQGRLTESI
jgi:hypothetical protein